MPTPLLLELASAGNPKLMFYELNPDFVSLSLKVHLARCSSCHTLPDNG